MAFKDYIIILYAEGSNSEILSSIEQTIAALARLKPAREDRSISLTSKTRLMRPLITFMFLYACNCES